MGRSGTKYHYDWSKRQQAYLKQRNESWDFGAREAAFIWSRTGMTRHAGMQSKLLALHNHYAVDVPKEENADEKGRRIKRLERITHHLIRSLCDATEYTQKIRRNVLVIGNFPTSEGETASRAERLQLTAYEGRRRVQSLYLYQIQQDRHGTVVLLTRQSTNLGDVGTEECQTSESRGRDNAAACDAIRKLCRNAEKNGVANTIVLPGVSAIGTESEYWRRLMERFPGAKLDISIFLSIDHILANMYSTKLQIFLGKIGRHERMYISTLRPKNFVDGLNGEVYSNSAYVAVQLIKEKEDLDKHDVQQGWAAKPRWKEMA